MPKKLQIKLLSDAGELLNVVTCSSGNISVFRAHSAVDLRPYQRALAGVPTKERFVVTLDGAEYAPSMATTIGFGEGGIRSDLSTRNYLLEQGSAEEGVDALLLSLGLERYADTPCSSLPADEERRLRLLVASLQPNMALIINEPFEPISSQWRERAADILSSLARSQNALIVIPSLSYRPEGWIDNPAVARIQVGQTLQKTIGFGAAGSSANTLMEELKNKVRAEQNQEQAPVAAAAAVGAVVVQNPGEHEVSGTPLVAPRFIVSPHKATLAVTALVACSSVVYLALSYLPVSGSAPGSEQSGVTLALNNQPPPPPPVPETKEPPVSLPKPPAAAPQQPASLAKDQTEAAPVEAVAPQKKALFILDAYPAQIKEALLATTRGIPSDAAVAASFIPDSNQVAPQAPKNGNLFKLLERAGSYDGQNSGGDGAPSPYISNDPPPASWSPEEQQNEEPEDAEARREAIRQKFLEAIRAAAERRESEMVQE